MFTSVTLTDWFTSKRLPNEPIYNVLMVDLFQNVLFYTKQGKNVYPVSWHGGPASVLFLISSGLYMLFL